MMRIGKRRGLWGRERCLWRGSCEYFHCPCNSGENGNGIEIEADEVM